MIRNVQYFYAQHRFDLLLEAIMCLLGHIPREASLHNIAGAAYAGLGRFDEAIIAYARAIALQPGLADAHANLGVALKAIGRLDEALASYDRAIELAPDAPVAHYNRANVLRDLRRMDEALAGYDRAVALKPDYVDALVNRGNVLQNLERFDAALASYDRAIAADPGFAQAYANRGNVLHELRRMDEAQQSYRRAIQLKPDDADTWARALFLNAHMCDWAAFEGPEGIAALGVTTEAVPPFNMLALEDDPARHLARSVAWTRAKHGARQPVPAPPKAERIRIGYFSADFHSHATMFLMAGLFERHDYARFEVHAFSYGPNRQDEMRRRATEAFEHFHEVSGLSDAAIAAHARAQGIDIAVDLKGYTQDSRAEIFALGAAPVQIAWIGYPGSSGADFVDYIVADRRVIPDEARAHYTEKLICMPHSYQVNDDRRAIAGTVPSREALGLPREGFVFCCFNNSFKISPAVFRVWMRLVGRIEGSVLWLLRDNRWVEANLRQAAAREGIAPERLVFADRMATADHLARHAHADLFLDSFAYNAHTTASDALWAGVPVVTKMGASFAARVAGSLLHAAGLPELIADNDAGYEALALSLAQDAPRLAAVRARIAETRSTMPLFDTALFTRHIEKAYGLVFDRHARGLAPEHIDVPA